MFVIIPCGENETTFYTIYNPSNGLHAHAKTKKQVIRLIECAESISKYGCPKGSYGTATYLNALNLLYTGKKL